MVSTAPLEPSPPDPLAPNDLSTRASTLANELGETDPAVCKLLRRLIQRVGWSLCKQALEDTHEIEANGGIWSVSEKKRHTRGGVFFALLKSRSGPARGVIHLHQSGQTKEAKKSALAFPWEERGELVREALQHRGTAMTAKLTLVGRPDKVVQRQDFVVTALEYKGAPSLPKGLPSPKSTRTTYTVYITAKQWRKVAELLKNPEDQLIVEGYCMLDPEVGSIAVLAQSATTKVLQRRKVDKSANAAETAAPAPASAPAPAPASAPAPAPAPAPSPPAQAAPTEEEQLRALLKQRLAGGQTLEAFATRAGVPLRLLQDFHDARPSSLTKAQRETLLQKLRQVIK